MPEEATAVAKTSERDTQVQYPRSIRWQMKLLPLMMTMLATLTVVFAAGNFWEIRSIQKDIESTDKLDIEKILDQKNPLPNADATPDITFADRSQYLQWEVTAILEADAMNRRYHQATAISLTRTYIVFIGFTTGMILALVGATFILGKLRESSSRADVKSEFLKMSLVSASPGLMLAGMGTILILATIFARTDVKVTDEPLYLTALPTGVSGQQNAVPQDVRGRQPAANATSRSSQQLTTRETPTSPSGPSTSNLFARPGQNKIIRNPLGHPQAGTAGSSYHAPERPVQQRTTIVPAKPSVSGTVSPP